MSTIYDNALSLVFGEPHLMTIAESEYKQNEIVVFGTLKQFFIIFYLSFKTSTRIL